MEPYKEIVNFNEALYFKGKATMKYGADVRTHSTTNQFSQLFEHRIYYDIQVRSITPISKKQFDAWKPAFQLTNIKDNKVVANYQNENYLIETDLIVLHEKLVPDHVQTEGDELHGDFVETEVVFRMNRPATGFRCHPNHFTGKEEERDGKLYKEITTGNLLSDKETCETTWICEEDGGKVLTCEENALTGNREWKNSCVRYEYYSGNLNPDGLGCETYWGEWICNCEQGKWTGKTKTQDNWIWREYYNADCTTYWEKYEAIRNESLGCLPVILGILALLWAALCIWWTIKYGSFIPILFGIGIPLFLTLLGSGINFLGRYSVGFSRIFSLLLNVAAFILILAFINGLFHLFDGAGSESKPHVDNTYDEQTVEEIDPFKQDESNYFPESGQKPGKGKRITLKWTDFHGKKYQGSFVLQLSSLRKSTYHLNSLESQAFNSYAPIYQSVYEKDRYFLTDLYHMLDSIRIRNQQNKTRFAHTIVSMVQSISYVLILENDCEDPLNLRNPQIREMILTQVPCDGNAPYGLKTPTQFLESFKGDCDTRTLLLYTIFKHYQYDVAIINSAYYGHSMLGLSLPDLTGAYKVANGVKYYFWETTEKGFLPGQLDRRTGKLELWKIEIN